MGVLNAREARVTDWTARSVGAIWRAFDLQLATKRDILARQFLAMETAIGKLSTQQGSLGQIQRLG